MYTDSIVIYNFSRSVFITDFPDLSFQKTRIDTCNTYGKLDFQIKANIEEVNLPKFNWVLSSKSRRKKTMKTILFNQVPEDH